MRGLSLTSVSQKTYRMRQCGANSRIFFAGLLAFLPGVTSLITSVPQSLTLMVTFLIKRQRIALILHIEHLYFSFLSRFKYLLLILKTLTQHNVKNIF